MLSSNPKPGVRTASVTGGRSGLGLSCRKPPASTTTKPPTTSHPAPLEVMTSQLTVSCSPSQLGITTSAVRSSSAPSSSYRCLSPTVVPFPTLPDDEEARQVATVGPVLLSTPTENCPISVMESDSPPMPRTIGRRSRALSLPVTSPGFAGPPIGVGSSTLVNASPESTGCSAATTRQLDNCATPSTVLDADRSVPKEDTVAASRPRRLTRRRSVLVTSLRPPPVSELLLAKRTTQPNSIPPSQRENEASAASQPSPSAVVSVTSPAPLLRSTSLPPGESLPTTPSRPSLFKRSSLALGRLTRSTRSASRVARAETSLAPVDCARHQYFSFSDFIMSDRHPAAQRATLRRLHRASLQAGAAPISPGASLRVAGASPARKPMPFTASPPRADVFSNRMAHRRTWHVTSHELLTAIRENALRSDSPGRAQGSRPSSFSSKTEYQMPSSLNLPCVDELGTPKAGFSLSNSMTTGRRSARKRIPFATARTAYRKEGSRGRPTVFMSLHRLHLAVHDCNVPLALSIINNQLSDLSAAISQHASSIKYIFLKAMANRLESVTLALYRRGFPSNVNDTIAVRSVQPYPHHPSPSTTSSASSATPASTSNLRARLTPPFRRSLDECRVDPATAAPKPTASPSPLPSIFLLAVALKMGALVEAMLAQADLTHRWLGLTPIMVACLNRRPGVATLVSDTLAVPGSVENPTLDRFAQAKNRPVVILQQLLAYGADPRKTIAYSQVLGLVRWRRLLRLTDSPPLGPYPHAGARSSRRQPGMLSQSASSSSLASCTSSISDATSKSTLSGQPSTVNGGRSDPHGPLVGTVPFAASLMRSEPSVGPSWNLLPMVARPSRPNSTFDSPPSDDTSRATFRAGSSSYASSRSSATVCIESFSSQRHLSTESPDQSSLFESLARLDAVVRQATCAERCTRLFTRLSPLAATKFLATPSPVPEAGSDDEARDQIGPLPSHQLLRSPETATTLLSHLATLPSHKRTKPLRRHLYMTALDFAILPGYVGSTSHLATDVDYVQALLEHLSDRFVARNQLALVLQQDLVITLTLLKRGANPYIQRDLAGNTPLHLAARAGLLDLCLLYLWLGLDPDCPGENGWTALHEAMSWGHRNVSLQLISQGAHCYRCNLCGKTPLQLALLFGHSVADIESLVDLSHLTAADIVQAQSILEFASSTLGLPSPVLRGKKMTSDEVLSVEMPTHPSRGRQLPLEELCALKACHSQSMMAGEPEVHGPSSALMASPTNRWSIPEFGTRPYPPLVRPARSFQRLRPMSTSMLSMQDILARDLNGEVSLPSHSMGLPPLPQSPSRHSADASWGHPSSSLTTQLPFPSSKLVPLARNLSTLSTNPSSSCAGQPAPPVLDKVAESTHGSRQSSKLKRFKRWSSSELKRTLFSLW